jgi:argininosuccinate synthase
MRSADEHVTGQTSVRLYKGQASVVARSSPSALYDPGLSGSASREGSSARPNAPGSSSCLRFPPARRAGFATTTAG